MNHRSVRDTREFQYGAEAERIVKSVFLTSGFSVIPRCDYESPVIETPDGPVVLPDLDVSGYGHRLWVEVKRKTRPGFFRIWDEYTHYIERRLWDDYYRVQEITTAPVLVTVCEDSSGERIAQWIADLSKRKKRWDDMIVGGTKTGEGVYFPRTSFAQLQEIIDGLIADPHYQTEFDFAEAS